MKGTVLYQPPISFYLVDLAIYGIDSIVATAAAAPPCQGVSQVDLYTLLTS